MESQNVAITDPNPAELYWCDLMARIDGTRPKRASLAENQEEHIDWWRLGEAYDVKGPKSLYRGGPQCLDRILVEWSSRGQKPECREIRGWVRGKADWIAFQYPHFFMHIKRAELQDLVKDVNWKERLERPYTEDYVSYGRHVDRFCWVPFDDVKKLPSTQLIWTMSRAE